MVAVGVHLWKVVTWVSTYDSCTCRCLLICRWSFMRGVHLWEVSAYGGGHLWDNHFWRCPRNGGALL